MRRYGQFCPVAKAAEVFCPRWTALILRNILWGAHRFCDIRRGVPMMSPTLLSQRLRDLEAEGIVARRRQGRAVFYRLTGAGLEFAPLIEAMGIWGQRWARRELTEGEVDMDLLLWGIERTARADAFGRRARGPDRVHRPAGAQGHLVVSQRGRALPALRRRSGRRDRPLSRRDGGGFHPRLSRRCGTWHGARRRAARGHRRACGAGPACGLAEPQPTG